MNNHIDSIEVFQSIFLLVVAIGLINKITQILQGPDVELAVVVD
jgi:hypothetical protein